MPSARNIPSITPALPARAKPTAVPRNGAEQGVASRVAKAPVTKCPARLSSGAVRLEAALATKRGSGTSKSPTRWQAKIVTRTAIAAMKAGSWNWTPQPIERPAAFTAMSAPAMTRNETTMPAAVARNPARTARGARPPWLTTEMNFRLSTGSTQGIRLRIRPPISATPSMASSEGPGSSSTAEAPCVIVVPCSSARPPSLKVKVTLRPVSLAPTGSGCVSGRSKVASWRSAEKAVRGVPRLASGLTSGMTSGCMNGWSDRARISSAGLPLSDTSCVLAMLMPDVRASPGTLARALARICASASGVAAPAGIASARSKCSGMHCSAQTRMSSPELQVERLAFVCDLQAEREDDMVLVAERLDAEHGDALRRRVEQGGVGEVL